MPFRVTLPLCLVVAFAAAGLVTGRRSAVGDPELITVVSSLPRSGSARGQTDTIVNGIRLALEGTGSRGKTARGHEGPKLRCDNGAEFVLDFQDLDDATAAAGQWTIEQEIANANQAKTDPDVMVYIGTYNSGAAKVSMPILNRSHLLMISPANTAENLTKPGTGGPHEPMCYRPTGEVNYTRCIPTDDLQGANAAHWAKELGARKVYVLDDNEVYGQGIASQFKARCERIGVDVLGRQSIDSKAQDFKTLMTTVRKLEPDLVYFGGTSQTKGGQLFSDMVEVGLRVPMMGPDGCFEQALVNAVALDKFQQVPYYATYGGLPVDALTAGKGKEFVDKYTAKHGGPPKEAYSTYGYECGLAALEAIRKAGVKDRDAIRKAGLSIKDFDGATGRWSFDANGDSTNQTMSGNKVVVEVGPDGKPVSGQFRFVKQLVLPADGK